MKISKIVFGFLMVCFSLTSYSQNLKYQLYLNEGIQELNLGNFLKADSLFDASFDIYPHKDAYFNKALSQLSQNNQCGFCDNLYMASFYDDQEADSLYNMYCVKKQMLFQSPYDSLFPLYANKKYEIIEKDNCGKRIQIQFFDEKDSMIASLKIINKRYYYSNLSYNAEYPGGDEMLNKFLENNIVYPQIAKDNDIQGRVYLSFIVGEEGLVRDVNIVIGVNKFLDNEALRVLRLIPKWIPATKNGVPVFEVRTLNIDFSL